MQLRGGGEGGRRHGVTTTRVVQFPTGRWDGSNNAFAAVPVEQRCSPGDFNEGDGNKGTAFYISWKWAKEFSGRAFAAHVRRTETVRLGNTTGYVPCVVFRGKETCEAVFAVVTDDFVESLW